MPFCPLYLMLKPDRATARAIAALRQRLGIDSSYDAARFHVTLLPLGDARDYSTAMLDAFCRALASISTEPLPILFDRVRNNALTGSHFGQLYELQRSLRRSLAAAGLPVRDYDFRPHLSLAYGTGPLRNIPVLPIEWLAGEILLVRSIHGQGRHELMASWRLFARQQSFAFA